MKALFALILALLVPVSYSVVINDWETTVSLADDGNAQWTVKISFDSNVENVYYIVSSVSDLQVTADHNPIKCMTETVGVGTSIKCNVKASNFTYIFKASDMISRQGSLSLFSHRFNVPVPAKHYTAKIELPVGAALVSEEKLQGTGLLPFEPVWTGEDNKTSSRGSDGRTIYVSWSIDNAKVGEGIDARVIYESFDGGLQALAFIMILIIVIIIGAAAFLIRRKNYKHVLPILTEPERKTMEILLREGKSVDQRTIIKELDYSKPKVSRLVHDLQERGLIELERKGRNNLLKLKKTERKTGGVIESKKD
ncbi:MAG: hypothetical protein HY364_00555 [Candidatus Aenigmarchaeota archaeon]|nr:hypothetical protein [Candidatus Aenigmarchaeota archaeon]